MADEVTKGDAIAMVAREGGPESAGFLANLMAHSERETAWIQEAVSDGHKRDAEIWKERALSAERELFEVRSRILDLIGLGDEA